MKNLLICLGGAMVLAGSVATAQGVSKVRVLDSEVMRNGNMLNIAMAVDYNPLVMSPQDNLIVTPMVVNGSDTLALDPIVFSGSTANSVDKRMINLYGEDALKYEKPYETVAFSRRDMRERKGEMRRGEVPANQRENVMLYRKSVPFQSWMAGSEIILGQDYYACSNMIAQNQDRVGAVAEPVTARIMYIVPDYEMPQRGTRDLTAYVNFEVDKSQIKPSFMNNEDELERIYIFTDAVMDDKDVEMESIRIKGFASPEAPYDYNDRLASARVNALKENIRQKYNLESDMFIVEHVAEDWDSLRHWIDASDLQYRTQLLDIIDNTSNPDARDAKIRALDNSVTYNMLLNEVYPELRRVDYSIDYKIMPFTADRGREMMTNTPSEMSLVQYYYMADSYDSESPEWNDVYTLAVQHHPNDPVCSNNAAAIAMKNGDYETAKKHLERVKNDPRCQNNLGIVYLREGNTQEAERLFRTAANEGSQEAAFNLANLQVLR